MSSALSRWPLVAVMAAAAAAVLALGGPPLVGGPTYVDQVVIVNPSRYDIHVEVRGDDRAGWMSVTTADRESTSAAVDVLDQGAVWIFRFRAQGRQGGELPITRTALQQARWSIEVPTSVVERFRQLQAPPAP